MKFLIHCILFLLLVTLQGCFEILEEVNLNPNGSGALTLTINASQSKGTIDNLISKDSIGEFKIPHRNDIEAALADVNAKLKTTKGISNVVITRDFTNYILVIKCNFSNAAALNSAINDIWLLYDKKAQMQSVFFTYNQKNFNRNLDYALIKNLKNKLGNQARDVLSKATYTMIYRFPLEIKSQTNLGAIPSKSKKATILKTSLLDIVTGKKNIDNEIKLN